MSNQFKCVENQEHVDQVKVTIDDCLDVFNFLAHFEIPCSFTQESLEQAYNKCTTNADRHNLVHQLLDDVATAAKNGNEVVCGDPIFTKVMQELIATQDKCRSGEGHD
jgi:isopentenyl phosphate kinase